MELGSDPGALSQTVLIPDTSPCSLQQSTLRTLGRWPCFPFWRSCTFSLGASSIFFWVSLSPKGRLGSRGLRGRWRQLWGPRVRETAFLSQAFLSHPVHWMGSLCFWHQKSPPAQLQPASPWDLHGPQTASQTASFSPAEVYSFQSFLQRRGGGCSTSLCDFQPQEHHFPSSKGHITSG